jgi:hypothetical protein
MLAANCTTVQTTNRVARSQSPPTLPAFRNYEALSTINLPEAWLKSHYGDPKTWTNGPPILSRFDR